MRKGSLEYRPHRRAKRQLPRQRSAPRSEENIFLGFVAFKAGMTHVMMIDESNSPSKGTEVARAATVLEIPKVFIYGMRFYRKGYAYREIAGEFYDAELAKKVGIKNPKHDAAEIKKRIKDFEDVTALAFLDASGIGGNKRVMRFEIPVGGKGVEDKAAFIEQKIGKEVRISSMVKPGEHIDVTSVTKGKGWAGVVKRFGVATQVRKATNKVRHVGTLGPWHPAKVMFGVPQAGHMGYNYRTELNKIVLRIGTPADAQSVTPKGGFINYGLIRNDYAVVDGSVPGPAKRLVRIRKSLRGKGVAEPKVQYISTSSKQGV